MQKHAGKMVALAGVSGDETTRALRPAAAEWLGCVMPQAPVLRYVLSAGRTGTVFLERLMNRKIEGVVARHEPSETRYQMMLANLRNDWGIGHRLLACLFERSRSRRNAAAGPCYVEINPFLCPMTDLVPRQGHALRIVHVVRDPAEWAGSITSFKASSRFRRVIDYIPFAKPYPAPRPEGWRAMDEYERALWRWNWCNARIAMLRDACDAYLLVRYEDLFSPDEATRLETLRIIGETLALPGPLVASAAEMDLRANAFNDSSRRFDRKAAQRICGQLARTYGYDY